MRTHRGINMIKKIQVVLLIGLYTLALGALAERTKFIIKPVIPVPSSVRTGSQIYTEYTVTNNLPFALSNNDFTQIPTGFTRTNVSSSSAYPNCTSPMALNPGQTCAVAFFIDSSQLATSYNMYGPMFCHTPANPVHCSVPTTNDRISFTQTSGAGTPTGGATISFAASTQEWLYDNVIPLHVINSKSSTVNANNILLSLPASLAPYVAEVDESHCKNVLPGQHCLIHVHLVKTGPDLSNQIISAAGSNTNATTKIITLKKQTGIHILPAQTWIRGLTNNVRVINRSSMPPTTETNILLYPDAAISSVIDTPPDVSDCAALPPYPNPMDHCKIRVLVKPDATPLTIGLIFVEGDFLEPSNKGLVLVTDISSFIRVINSINFTQPSTKEIKIQNLSSVPISVKNPVISSVSGVSLNRFGDVGTSCTPGTMEPFEIPAHKTCSFYFEASNGAYNTTTSTNHNNVSFTYNTATTPNLPTNRIVTGTINVATSSIKAEPTFFQLVRFGDYQDVYVTAGVFDVQNFNVTSDIAKNTGLKLVYDTCSSKTTLTANTNCRMRWEWMFIFEPREVCGNARYKGSNASEVSVLGCTRGLGI
jgi:hypothetical protein